MRPLRAAAVVPLSLLVSTALLGGCFGTEPIDGPLATLRDGQIGGGDPDAAEDGSTPDDTGPREDGGPVDLGFADTGLPMDAGVDDTGVEGDTGVEDPDTGVEDDAGDPPDAGDPIDTGVGFADADVFDSGLGACPAPGGASNPSPAMSFFVTSVGNGMNGGNYSGLQGADDRCQCLAAAVGAGDRTWRAYLSTAPIPGVPGGLVHARDRIGSGPWFNYRGELIAQDVATLHSSPPSYLRILDEYGNRVTPTDRDVLTGTAEDGTALTEFPMVPGTDAPTCFNWTEGTAIAFHWAGQGDWDDPAVNAFSWNSDHSAPCDPAGMANFQGTGKLYCFATDNAVRPDGGPGVDAGVTDAGGAPDSGLPNELVASVASVSLTEGGSATFTVRLSQAPATPVTVSVVSSDTGAVTAAPASLVFTAANFSAPQTVNLTAVQDADTNPETGTIRLEAANFTALSLGFTVADDDVLSIVTSAPTVTVVEGASATFTVRLSAAPPADATITLVSGDPAAATVAPAALVFTAANFSTPQTVTVTGIADDDIANESVSLNLSGAGIAQVAVTVTDDDTQAIVLSPAALTIGEGQTGSMTARLAFRPAANVSVTVASSDPGAATAAPATLSFTPANFATPQTVTLTALDDADTNNETVTLSFSSAGVADATATLSVNDDDVQAIVAAPTTLRITEGATGSFTVRLSQQPAADVTVTVSSSDPGAATAAPASLTFTAANFATPQTVTVTAVQDDDVAPESVTISLSGGGLSASTVVNVDDDDTQSIQLSTTNLAVTEGATATFTVRLAARPAGNVTLSLVSSDPSVATGAPGLISFAPASFDTPQTVTVSGVQDDDLVNGTANLVLSAAGLANATVAVTVTDDDTQAIRASAAAVTVAEGGSQSLGVSLAFRPAANVTVTAASGDTGALTVAPASLSFTPANYATPQNLSLTGVQDADSANESVTLTLASAGVASVPVTVTVTDDETQSLIVSTQTLGVLEGGTATFTVRLSAQPTANLTVSIASSDNGAATVSPATLTFTAGNYTTPQTVTVSGVQDADTANEAVTLTVSAPSITPATIALTVTDDEVISIQLTPASLTVAEGGTGTFTARLSLQPPGAVTVTIASSDAGAATAAPAALSFDPTNFSTPQTVTVTGVQDADAQNETVTLTLSGTGVQTRTLTVTVNDDETGPPAMSFFVTSRRIERGGTPVGGGNLGGLAGADAFCLALAREASAGDNRAWRAYLSSTTVDARDRIGAGPWHNANGVQIAANVTALHTTPPATNLILDERGRAWNAVSTRHDILTGSNSQGRRPSAAELMPLFTFPDGSFTYANPTNDFSCQSWTSDGDGAAPPENYTDYAIIGHVDHTDILNGGATNPRSYSWNSSHVTACDIGNMEADLGDARVYCFVAN